MTRIVVLLACVVFMARSVFAQDVFQFQVPPGSAAQGGAAIFVGQPGVGLLSVEPFEGARPVLGAPYSADAVTTATQLLANGNRIDNEMTAKVARDSRGRIRQEHQALFLGALVADRQSALVTISDPVAGTYFTLDDERRVAFRMRTRPPASETRGSTGAAPIPPQRGAAPMPPPSVTTMPVPPPPGDFNVSVERGISRAPAMTAGRPIGMQALALEGDSITKQLGEKDIEGVRVTGTMTTITIPADRIGNQFPIEIVSERWYSPELQVVVMSRRSDPRFGDTIYRLINIVRAEPLESLFEVPAGYRVEQFGPPSR